MILSLLTVAAGAVLGAGIAEEVAVLVVLAVLALVLLSAVHGARRFEALRHACSD